MEGLEPRRCPATNRAGERCAPIPGGYVCVMHGGAAPAVRQSARARLLAGADLAIDYLLNLLTPKPPCETCGRSDADRDRGGVMPEDPICACYRVHNLPASSADNTASASLRPW